MQYRLLICLLPFTILLSGCANMFHRDPQTADLKHICYQLKQQLALVSNNSINYPNRTPTQQASLNRQYYKYQCDEVLNQ